MKVVLLAGGLGTRMREETEFRPKPMVEIGGKPMLWHIMTNFAAHGFTEFIVCAGYKKSLIQDYFSDQSTSPEGRGKDQKSFLAAQGDGWKVDVVDTGELSETGERIKKVQDLIGEENFLCTYGDGLAPVNIGALVDFHSKQGTFASVTLAHPTSRFGIAEVDESKKARGFREKPILDDLVSIGFFVFGPEIFSYLSGGGALESGPLHQLATDGQLSGFRHEGFWQPLDTYRELLLMQALWDTGDAPWLPTSQHVAEH
jgi:glucose-1-phosphate cytidylyltransferase